MKKKDVQPIPCYKCVFYQECYPYQFPKQCVRYKEAAHVIKKIFPVPIEFDGKGDFIEIKDVGYENYPMGGTD